MNSIGIQHRFTKIVFLVETAVTYTVAIVIQCGQCSLVGYLPECTKDGMNWWIFVYGIGAKVKINMQRNSARERATVLRPLNER